MRLYFLMYSSDYPHAESRFPDSTDIVLAWKLGEEEQKLFWQRPPVLPPRKRPRHRVADKAQIEEEGRLGVPPLLLLRADVS